MKVQNFMAVLAVALAADSSSYDVDGLVGEVSSLASQYSVAVLAWGSEDISSSGSLWNLYNSLSTTAYNLYQGFSIEEGDDYKNLDVTGFNSMLVQIASLLDALAQKANDLSDVDTSHTLYGTVNDIPLLVRNFLIKMSSSASTDCDFLASVSSTASSVLNVFSSAAGDYSQAGVAQVDLVCEASKTTESSSSSQSATGSGSKSESESGSAAASKSATASKSESESEAASSAAESQAQSGSGAGSASESKASATGTTSHAASSSAAASGAPSSANGAAALCAPVGLLALGFLL